MFLFSTLVSATSCPKILGSLVSSLKNLHYCKSLERRVLLKVRPFLRNKFSAARGS